MNSKSEVIEPPLISVVVPVALGRGSLDVLMSWVENALLQDFHLVIVLDGTIQKENDALNLLHSLTTYSNLVILNGSYGSPGAARNAGLRVATGRWVFFWDSDDLPNIQNAQLMILEAERKNSHFAVGSFEWRVLKPVYQSELHLLNGSLEENLFRIGLNPGIWRFAFRRTQISFKFSEFQMAEDQIFILQNTDFAQNYLTYQEIVYCYFTGNSTQQTSTKAFIPDLTQSLVFTSQVFKKLVSSNQEFIARIFLLRQLLAALKHGSQKVRIRLILISPKIIKSLGLSNSFLLVVDTLKVFKIKRSVAHTAKVIVPLTGGLGNQLFQLAAALSLADGKGVLLDQSIGEPRTNDHDLPEITSFELPRNVNISPKKRSNIFLRKVSGFMLRSGVAPRPIEEYALSRLALKMLWRIAASLSLQTNVKPFAGSGVGYFDFPKIRDKALLYGYFQSYRWPDSVKMELQKLSPRMKPAELNQLRAESDSEKPLVVHIRLGDYRNEESFGLLDRTYFLTATQELWSTQNFGKIWLFSDEPTEAIKYFPLNLIPQIRLMSNFQNSTALTFECMRFGHGYVISNSTFSWWGAYLSYRPNAPVIAPSPWFKTLADPIDLVPPEWFRKDT